jgi:hypothetical protein
MPKGMPEATLAYEAAHGVTPMDGVQAQTEIKGINAAAGAAGRREGNIAILNKSLPGLGDQVLTTLDGVTRTDYPAFNSLIVAGNNAAGNPQERAYAVALQGMITDYARIISGATGVTTDTARGQANDLLKGADSKDAIRAAVKQMTQQELGVVNRAGPAALELLANKSSYPHATKIMNALGFNAISDSFDAKLTDPTTSTAAAPTGGKRVYNPATGKIE